MPLGVVNPWHRDGASGAGLRSQIQSDPHRVRETQSYYHPP